MFQRGSILNMKLSGRLNSVMTSLAGNHWNQRESILESGAMTFMYPRRDSNPDYRRERAVNSPLFDRDMPPRISVAGHRGESRPRRSSQAHCPMTIDNTY